MQVGLKNVCVLGRSKASLRDDVSRRDCELENPVWLRLNAVRFRPWVIGSTLRSSTRTLLQFDAFSAQISAG
jgi:hypothetical protein